MFFFRGVRAGALELIQVMFLLWNWMNALCSRSAGYMVFKKAPNHTASLLFSIFTRDAAGAMNIHVENFPSCQEVDGARYREAEEG